MTKNEEILSAQLEFSIQTLQNIREILSQGFSNPNLTIRKIQKALGD